MAIITKRRKAYSVIYQKADENGKMIPVWETYYDYKTALARKKEIEDTDNNSKMNITENTTVIDFLTQFVIKIGVNQWSNSRYESNIGITNNYLSKVLGDTKIKEINQDFGQKTINQLRLTPALGKRNQSKTEFIPYSMLRSCYTLLKSCFDYLVQEGLITSNPFYTCDVPYKKTKKTSNEWNLNFIEHFFDSIDDIRLFMFMHVMFSTGLGIYEVNAIAWEDVHIDETLLENDTCYVTSNKYLQRLNKNTLQRMDSKRIIKQFECDGFNATNTSLALFYKDKPERKIHIHKPLALLLNHWKAIQHEYISENNPHNLLITLANGKPCDNRNISKLYHRVCEEAHLNDLTIMKFKNFSQKQSADKEKTNADYYYLSIKTELVLPKQKVGTKNNVKLNKTKFNKKIAEIIPKKENKDMKILLQQLKDNPELKMKLIEKLKTEL